MNLTDKNEYITKFAELYGAGGTVSAFFAPGRVNLIGEHTDYNGGHVFPCALTLGTGGLIRLRADRLLRLYSMNCAKDGILTVSLDKLERSSNSSWTDYFTGVVKEFEDRGFVLPSGADILIAGDLPGRSGLASSASLEILMGTMLRNVFGFLSEISPIDLAVWGQSVENHFIGVPCGVMDQFSSAMGRKDNAIFFSTHNFHFQYVPLALKDMSLVITNSNVRVSAAAAAYVQRHEECALALHDLKKLLPITYLCDILGDQFEEYRTCIHDPVVRKRAKHVIYENQRTIQASSALAAGNLQRFGLLMKQSHISLRDDFEVSCPELDFLTSLAWDQPSCIGSRLTGGGFGGCTVSIVKNSALEEFQNVLGEAYQKQFGKTADFYIAGVGDGARQV